MSARIRVSVGGIAARCESPAGPNLGTNSEAVLIYPPLIGARRKRRRSLHSGNGRVSQNTIETAVCRVADVVRSTRPR
jgi:hypothetical protein